MVYIDNKYGVDIIPNVDTDSSINLEDFVSKEGSLLAGAVSSLKSFTITEFLDLVVPTFHIEVSCKSYGKFYYLSRYSMIPSILLVYLPYTTEKNVNGRLLTYRVLITSIACKKEEDSVTIDIYGIWDYRSITNDNCIMCYQDKTSVGALLEVLKTAVKENYTEPLYNRYEGRLEGLKTRFNIDNSKDIVEKSCTSSIVSIENNNLQDIVNVVGLVAEGSNSKKANDAMNWWRTNQDTVGFIRDVCNTSYIPLNNTFTKTELLLSGIGISGRLSIYGIYTYLNKLLDSSSSRKFTIVTSIHEKFLEDEVIVSRAKSIVTLESYQLFNNLDISAYKVYNRESVRSIVIDQKSSMEKAYETLKNLFINKFLKVDSSQGNDPTFVTPNSSLLGTYKNSRLGSVLDCGNTHDFYNQSVSVNYNNKSNFTKLTAELSFSGDNLGPDNLELFDPMLIYPDTYSEDMSKKIDDYNSTAAIVIGKEFKMTEERGLSLTASVAVLDVKDFKYVCGHTGMVPEVSVDDFFSKAHITSKIKD